MKKILFISIFAILLFGCSENNSTRLNDKEGEIKFQKLKVGDKAHGGIVVELLS